jgi:hypothetical protein
MAVVLLWVIHTTISFGTPATSTWTGMNLAKATTLTAPPSLLNQLIEHHQLTPLARVPPFSPLSSYNVTQHRSGDPALTELFKSGNPSFSNFNNAAYSEVSNLYLTNDLNFMEYAPFQYAKQVIGGMGIWFTPADRSYFGFNARSGYVNDESTMSSYRHLYDAVFQLEVRGRGLAIGPGTSGEGIGWSQISLVQVLIYGLALVGVPFLIVRRWKRFRSDAVALLIPGLMFLQPFVAMNLIDYGENNRFRFEAGTLSVTLALFVVVSLWTRLVTWRDTRRWERDARRRSNPPVPEHFSTRQ